MGGFAVAEHPMVPRCVRRQGGGESNKLMETFRYIIALLLVTLVPAVLAYWLLLQTLLPLWRRIGWVRAQIVLWAAVLVVAFALWFWRGAFLWTDYGFNPLLTAAGVVFLAGAAVFRLQIERFLPWRVQLGLPEIDPAGHAEQLVTEGPYAHTRHPRYIQVFLALLGWAMLANYPAGYLAALLWVPFVLSIIRLEERELQRRFGAAYDEYAARVPRFWPHATAANHRVKA